MAAAVLLAVGMTIPAATHSQADTWIPGDAGIPMQISFNPDPIPFGAEATIRAVITNPNVTVYYNDGIVSTRCPQGSWTRVAGEDPIGWGSSQTWECTATFTDDRPEKVLATYHSAFSSPANVGGLGADDPGADVPLLPPVTDISLDKTRTVPGGEVHPGDTVTWSVTATNAGPNQGNGVTIVDDVPPSFTGVSATMAGGSCTVTGQRVSCASTDAMPVGDSRTVIVSATAPSQLGCITNAATVTAVDNDPSTANNTASDQVCVREVPAPEFRLRKEASGPITGPQADGTYVAHYSIVASNTGNADGSYPAISDVPAVDPNLVITSVSWSGQTSGSRAFAGDASSHEVALTSAPTFLAAGAQHSWQVNVAFQYRDAAAATSGCSASGGGLTNTASMGTDVTASTCVEPPLPPTTELSLTKQAGAVSDVNGNGVVDVGDRVPYSFQVANGSTVVVSTVTITDALLGLSAAPLDGTTCRTLSVNGLAVASLTALQPGDVALCTANAEHVLTQAEVDAGLARNVASVTGRDPQGGQVSDTGATADTTIDRTSGIAMVKSSGAIADANGSGRQDAGDTVTYTFRVTNTGNTTLSPVRLTDAKLGLDNRVILSSLAGGETTTWSTTHTLTQAEVDAGGIVNNASITGTPPSGVTAPSAAGSSDSLTITRAPALAVAVSAANRDEVLSNSLLDTGETLTYTYVVTNTGNTTVDSVSISDAALGGVSVTCPSTTLAPGQTMTCRSAPLTLTQAQIDGAAAGDGIVVDRATAVGSSGGQSVTSVPASVSVRVNTAASLELALTTSPDGSTPVSVGDTITYRFTVTNTGAVTVGALAIRSDFFAAANITPTCESNVLAPGTSTTCTATHTVTHVNQTAGSVDVSATAAGNPPGVVTAATGSGVVSNPQTSSVPVSAGGNLQVSVSADLADKDSDHRADAGEQVTWVMRISNPTSSTISRIALSDSRLGWDNRIVDASACSLAPASFDGTLAAGASVVCRAKPAETVTAAQVDAGSDLVETVTATAFNRDGVKLVAGPVVASVPVDARIELYLAKFALVVDNDNSRRASEGDRIEYDFRVTNRGSRTLSVVRIDDPKLSQAGVGITCPDEPLAPGASMTCHAKPYTVTAADEKSGAVTNLATARAEKPGGNPSDSADDVVSNRSESSASSTEDIPMRTRERSNVLEYERFANRNAWLLLTGESGRSVMMARQLASTGGEGAVLVLLGAVALGAGLVLLRRRRLRE